VIYKSIRKVSGKWKPIILLRLYKKPLRFNKLKQLVGKINSKVLTDCLTELTKNGLISKTDTAHQSYHLTPAGIEVCGILNKLIKQLSELD
jgi:DNA-binding HxlR family transcriptional regulator